MCLSVMTESDSFEGVSAVQYTGSDVTDEAIHPVICDVKSSLTRATVVLDARWSDLTVTQRVAILRRFAEHLRLPVSLISLLPAENTIEVGWYTRCVETKKIRSVELAVCPVQLFHF